ncbi:MAG: hypothetical protein ACRC6I_04690, partial [Paracoccaceae bacterium]
LAPASGGGTANFLRADGAWAVPAGGGGGISDGDKGDVTVSGGGAVWTIDAGVVTLGKMADLPGATFVGRTNTGAGVPEALTPAQVRSLINVADGAEVNQPTNLSYTAATRVLASDTGTDVTLPLVSAGAAGLAPASGGGTVNFLRADGTWAAAGGGLTPLGLGDWWESYRISSGITQFGTFLAAAISGGTNNVAVPAASGLGHNPLGAFLRSSTTANSGYRYNSANLTAWFFGGGVGYKFRGKFLWRAFTNNTVRIGFLDTAASTDAQDGAYFEIIGSTIAAKTAQAAARTQAPATYTALIDTVYTFDIDANGAGTSVQFRVYENLNTVPVLDQTITTNIPNAVARAFGAGCVATNSAAAASDIGILYELGIGTADAFGRARG